MELEMGWGNRYGLMVLCMKVSGIKIKLMVWED